ncbi:MAG TPA: hypothetical protein VF950_27170 [Planctomycetota bacterium]
MSRRQTLDIALFGLLLLIGAAVVRTWYDEKPEVVPSPGRVDLLALIDPARDQVKGEWRRDGSALITPELPFGRLQIPYAPPDEYSLKLDVTRVAGIDSLNVGLVAEGRQFVAILDGMKDGDTAGIDLIAGKGFMENPTTSRGTRLLPERKSTVVYTVRRDRFTVAVDGGSVIDWPAEYAKVSAYHEWGVPLKNALFIGSYASRFRIDQMILTPIRGEGKSLR